LLGAEFQHQIISRVFLFPIYRSHISSNMASFFDNKARAAAAKAAAANASSSKTSAKNEDALRLQPWVEK